MTFASKYNSNSSSAKFTFKQIDNAPYVKCKQLYDEGFREGIKAFTIRGMFVNEASRYGRSAALICDGYYISLPAHMLKVVDEILQDPEAVADINAKKVGGFVYKYQNRNGGDSYGVKFIDINPPAESDLPF